MARPRSDTTTNPGVYIGAVTRVTGATCYVEVSGLAAGLEYGPAHYPAEYAPAAATDPANGPDPHSHGLPPLAAGDRVAVAFVAGRRDDLVVIARLA